MSFFNKNLPQSESWKKSSSLEYYWRPSFIGDSHILVFNENLGVSNENLGVFNENLGVFNENLGVSNENMRVYNENNGGFQ